MWRLAGFFFFSSRRRHTRCYRDWSSDVCSSDLLEEAGLVERAKDGDVGAYEELVRAHQQIAMRTAWLVTRDSTEAEDAVQEAYVKAYRALSRFREGAAFRPWLLAIVTNEARNRRRAVARADRLALRVAPYLGGSITLSENGQIFARFLPKKQQTHCLVRIKFPEDHRATMATALEE